MADTREASVSNPCLEPLQNLNAVVPTLSMHLGSLASHVLHRIQVCGVRGMPSHCQPLASICSPLHLGMMICSLDTSYACPGSWQGYSGSDHAFLTQLQWSLGIGSTFGSLHPNSSTLIILMLSGVHATCLVL